MKRRNLCNCPNCQTDDCLAGVELAALKRELTTMTLDRDERAKQKADFFAAIGELQAELAGCREELRLANEDALRLYDAIEDMSDEDGQDCDEWPQYVHTALAAHEARVSG